MEVRPFVRQYTVTLGFRPRRHHIVRLQRRLGAHPAYYGPPRKIRVSRYVWCGRDVYKAAWESSTAEAVTVDVTHSQ